MKNIFLILAVLAAGFFGATVAVRTYTPGINHAPQETAYDRVMRTNTLRCGWLASPVYMQVDTATGARSGLMVDYMTQLGKNLGLEIVWQEEIGRGDALAALATGRIDAYCANITINAERAKAVDYTEPYLAELFNIYVREGDTRFDNNLAAINDPAITIVALEGDVFGKMARLHFPKAKLIELPQLTPESDTLLNVATGKADVVIETPNIAAVYMNSNPGQLRQVALAKPFTVANIALPVAADGGHLKRMLDMATMEMLANRQMDAILGKYDPRRQNFARRALPYE